MRQLYAALVLPGHAQIGDGTQQALGAEVGPGGCSPSVGAGRCMK